MGKKKKKAKKKAKKKHQKHLNKTKRHRFSVGDSAKVKSGIRHEDNEKVDLSGWQGRVTFVEEIGDDDFQVSIEWDSLTILSMPLFYIEMIEEEESDWTTLFISTKHLVPAKARDQKEDVAQAIQAVTDQFPTDDDDFEDDFGVDHNFKIGDSVALKDGMFDPEFSDVHIGGWQGRIFAIDDYEYNYYDGDIILSIEWDSITIKNMPRAFIENSEKENLEWTQFELGTKKLLPVEPRDTEQDVFGTVYEISKSYQLDRFSSRHFNESITRREIPYDDFLDDFDLDDEGSIGELLDVLISSIEGDFFLSWEAVERQERKEHLTFAQKVALNELISFGDDDDENDAILYINGLARPTEPWYETVRKVSPRLILEVYDTTRSYFEEYFNGWPQLHEALEKHASKLMLPEGVDSPVDILPEEIQHRLWLQCNVFDVMGGIGQMDELTLEHTDDQYRIDIFMNALIDHKESVAFFDLTLEKMYTMLVIPEKDKKILTEAIMKRFDISSIGTPMMAHLDR